MAGCYLFLEAFYGFILEFDDAVAGGADEVVVMFPDQDVLIPCLTVMEYYLTGKPSLGKLFERTVDRRLADVWMTGLDHEVQLFYAEMSMGGKEYVKDDVPLAC